MKFLIFWIFCVNRLHTIYSDVEYVVPGHAMGFQEFEQECEIRTDFSAKEVILKAAKEASSSLLPQKSKDRYEKFYSQFCDRRKKKDVEGVDENIMLAYLKYYWTDFDGIVPFGAVQGGIDEAGRWSYIGQAYIHEQGLIPATIYDDNKTVCVSKFTGPKVCTQDYIKILCTKNVKNLKWVRSKNEDIHLLSDCRLVEGGIENQHVLYIGRVKHEKETIIGKVYPNHFTYSGLYTPYNSSAEIKYKTYEILTYNCNMKNLNITEVKMKTMQP